MVHAAEVGWEGCQFLVHISCCLRTEWGATLQLILYRPTLVLLPYERNIPTGSECAQLHLVVQYAHQLCVPSYFRKFNW